MTGAAQATAPPQRTGWRANAGRVVWLVVLVALAVRGPGQIFLSDMLVVISFGYQLVRLLIALVRRQPIVVRHAALGLLLCVLAWGALRWTTLVYTAQARERADALVTKVVAWRDGHGGQWPADLVAVTGLPPLRSSTAPRYGLSANGQPYLFYRDAWSGFDTWFYDFEAREWQFHPD